MMREEQGEENKSAKPTQKKKKTGKKATASERCVRSNRGRDGGNGQ
jgi:hypothetical protein